MSNGITFRDTLLEWFSSNRRDFEWRSETDTYRILIAEKMLQQTTYGHVQKVYSKFIKKYPNINSLANAEVYDVKRIIKPLGFHNQRSKQLVTMAKEIIEKHKGVIPINKAKLLALPGIGEYISNATLCFAHGQHRPIIDVNVRRVFSRVFKWGGLSDKQLEPILYELLPESKVKEFNWAIIDFSSLICSKKPKCSLCFAKDYCYFYSLRLNNRIKKY